MIKRIEFTLKNNLIIQYFYKRVFSFIFRFIGLFIKTEPNLILFNSFGGKKYNDSPKVIFEQLLNHPTSKKLKLVWALENPDNFDIPNAIKIEINSFKYFIIALKAKYWVSSVNIERGLKFKKDNTIYLNTWHGAGTKKIGNAVSKRKDYDFSNVNYLLVQSNFEKNIFINDFGAIEENFLLSGFPRSDELFKTEKKQIDIYKRKLKIPKDKKIILYAPTWRESKNNGSSYDLNIPLDIKKWQEKLTDEYVILFRTHTFTTNILNLKFNDLIIDVSDYPNVNHLLLISDILITDYSTIVFDYSILEKPFLCFGYDYKEYQNERGLYIDLEKEYPNGVQKTEDEILELILNMNYEKECEKTREFKSKYIEAGGNATELAIKSLLS
jgi:CDP-glycerol glycerophosphotransferase